MTAKRIFMIRPAAFGYNSETAVNNVFQNVPKTNPEVIQHQALNEFDELVRVLKAERIEVELLHEDPSSPCPDAVFSNNWLSTHPDQSLVTYPMYAPTRRRERNPRTIRYIIDNYTVLSHLAMEYFEDRNLFLEGTGSLIIDHEYGMVYGNRSPRTHEVPFYRLCKIFGYTPVLFDAFDAEGVPVYHTNVLMGIGEGFVLINRSGIPRKDWSVLVYYFEQTGKDVIEIDARQMAWFLGNVAFLLNDENIPYIVMSTRAYQAIGTRQKSRLERYGRIIHSDISTIETIGGGSVKCMITENYLYRRRG